MTPPGTDPERAIYLRVNGERRRVEVDPATPLLYVLRDDLRLNGPQFGCGAEFCGACKALIGDKAVPTCRLPVGEVGNAEITTLEGLSDEGELHPVQQAFIDEQALQCGFCANGMIITAAALVVRSNPSEQRIREEMSGNLCRCGTHLRIASAVKRAANEIWGESQ